MIVLSNKGVKTLLDIVKKWIESPRTYTKTIAYAANIGIKNNLAIIDPTCRTGQIELHEYYLGDPTLCGSHITISWLKISDEVWQWHVLAHGTSDFSKIALRRTEDGRYLLRFIAQRDNISYIGAVNTLYVETAIPGILDVSGTDYEEDSVTIVDNMNLVGNTSVYSKMMHINMPVN